MKLLTEKHLSFIARLYALPEESLESQLTQHIKLNAVYWALIAAHTLGAPTLLPQQSVLEFVSACRDSKGGYGAAPGHDGHVICTLHAIQIYSLFNVPVPDTESLVTYISGLQSECGAVYGDKWGELDMRITYAAIQALTLLKSLETIDVPKLGEWVLSCQNFDGGWGQIPGAESHAAYAFTALATLSLINRLDGINVDHCAWWLAMRQLPCGGFNGRPEKLEDVCYSWYVLSSLTILNKTHWIDTGALKGFILSAQCEDGGISDRPGDVPDVNHTCFGIAGLSLLGYDGLLPIDARYCLPVSTLRH